MQVTQQQEQDGHQGDEHEAAEQLQHPVAALCRQETNVGLGLGHLPPVPRGGLAVLRTGALTLHGQHEALLHGHPEGRVGDAAGEQPP